MAGPDQRQHVETLAVGQDDGDLLGTLRPQRIEPLPGQEGQPSLQGEIDRAADAFGRRAGGDQRTRWKAALTPKRAAMENM